MIMADSKDDKDKIERTADRRNGDEKKDRRQIESPTLKTLFDKFGVADKRDNKNRRSVDDRRDS